MAVSYCLPVVALICTRLNPRLSSSITKAASPSRTYIDCHHQHWLAILYWHWVVKTMKLLKTYHSPDGIVSDTNEPPNCNDKIRMWKWIIWVVYDTIKIDLTTCLSHVLCLLGPIHSPKHLWGIEEYLQDWIQILFPIQSSYTSQIRVVINEVKHYHLT